VTDAIEPHELAIIEPSAQLPAMLQAEMQRASDRARSAKSSGWRFLRWSAANVRRI
jgi:hypothetical protein